MQLFSYFPSSLLLSISLCRDLLEICEAQIQFARKSRGGNKIPFPSFGGSAGPDIAKSLTDIELAFERLVHQVPTPIEFMFFIILFTE